MLKQIQNDESRTLDYVFNPDQELIDFFDKISNQPLKLGTVRSANLKYRVKIMDLNLLSTPIRVGQKTGAIQINLPVVEKENILGNELFYLLLWAHIEFHIQDLSVSDMKATKYYKSQKRPIDELIDVYSKMVKLNPSDDNKKRYEQVIEILK